MLSLSCFVSYFTEQPYFTCSCTKPQISCESHISQHLLSPGNHTRITLITSVTEIHKLRVFNYLNLQKGLIIQKLKALTKFTAEVMKRIEDQSIITYKNLIIQKCNLDLIIKNFYKTSILNKEILNIATSNTHNIVEDSKFNLKNASVHISKIYESEFYKPEIEDDNFALLFKSDYSNEIDKINLETFEKSTICFSERVLTHEGGCCKIRKNKYFVHGGLGSCFSNLTMIIDINERSIVSLPSDSHVSYNELCFFNEEIYSFGGYNGNYINTCKKFNLARRIWINIQPLPLNNHVTSSSNLDNQILVCGYDGSELFNFNPYKSIFTTSKYSFKAFSLKYII